MNPMTENYKKSGNENLSDQMATIYRAVTARGIYLSQDRSDIQQAVKELSRSMAMPIQSDWERLKRLG